MRHSLEIALVVEDALSLAVMQKVLATVGRDFVVRRALVENGVGNLRASISKYRSASNVIAHVILADLDQEPCAPSLLAKWGLLGLPESMLFRVAVREVEAWVLADRASFADFAKIPVTKIPLLPETLADPKQTLINLVRKSRNRRLAAEIVPIQGVSMSKGALYNERLSQFVTEHWNVKDASSASPSLMRAVERLRHFRAEI